MHSPISLSINTTPPTIGSAPPPPLDEGQPNRVPLGEATAGEAPQENVFGMQEQEHAPLYKR